MNGVATQEHASDGDTGPLSKVADSSPHMPVLHGELPLTQPAEPAAEPPREHTRWDEPLYVTEPVHRDEYVPGQTVDAQRQSGQQYPGRSADHQPGYVPQSYGGEHLYGGNQQYGGTQHYGSPYAAANHDQNVNGGQNYARERSDAPQRTSMFAPDGHDGNADPAQAKRRSMLLKAGALVLVAVVAGVLWWLTHQPSRTQAAPQHTPTTNAQRAGFDFKLVHGPIDDANCGPHAYGTIKKFFDTNKCSSLKQSLYTTKDDSGAPVVSSVSVVTMADPADAKKLKHLTDLDGTGNVTDMITGGVRIPNGPKTLKGGGYASRLAGNTVTIVESGYFDGHPNDKTLTKISLGAVALR